MEDKLALEILKILQQGQVFGYTAVWNEIHKMDGFIAISNTKFKEIWDKLDNLGCIVSYNNQDQNYIKCWRINTDKNCISFYQDKIDKEIALEKREEDKKDIDYKLVKKQLDDYPTVQKRADDAIKLSRSAIVVSCLMLLLVMIKWIGCGK